MVLVTVCPVVKRQQRHNTKNYTLVHGEDIIDILVDGSGNVRIADFGNSMLLAEVDEMFSSSNTWRLRWLAPEYIDIKFEDMEEAKPTKLGDIYTFDCVMAQILSGKLSYGWMHKEVDIIGAFIRRADPFYGVQINVFLRQLSSRYLARKPGECPSIFEIMTILK
ncbi:hypothetical protein AZE42_11622 [Rhizopogon vesiculosus]|uniref:Protein kinase domain-containing protein n=1 Tax=Rhizopogon vesiculosus TaxID=180088 RepID=A0A1J8PXC2_9AGAM|nr:hypothetical protein AZE42_11622 [Rhizopogon vesiculosus]